MVTLPLTFLSSALMQRSLLPGWIQWTARFNPVNGPPRPADRLPPLTPIGA
jgi:hypothetical protein